MKKKIDELTKKEMAKIWDEIMLHIAPPIKIEEKDEKK